MSYSFILLGVVGIIYTFTLVEFGLHDMTFRDAVALGEAAINDLILIGAAIFFLVTLETRVKRNKVTKFLNELRGIAHVIDMHQLTKDPTIPGDQQFNTKHSPSRNLTNFQLKRYLDYCSEMLALVGKVAALYAQRFPDDVVVRLVNEIESLTNGLSRKIWQKIMILNDID